MASYMTDRSLAIASAAVTERTIEVRVHSVAGTPGTASIGSRIGTVSASHPKEQFSDGPTDGESQTTVASAFGVLSTTAAVTVRAYSVRDSGGLLGWADLDAAVTVPQGEPFILNAGTVKVRFRRPSAS